MLAVTPAATRSWQDSHHVAQLPGPVGGSVDQSSVSLWLQDARCNEVVAGQPPRCAAARPCGPERGGSVDQSRVSLWLQDAQSNEVVASEALAFSFRADAAGEVEPRRF